MINLFETYDQTSWDLHYSLLMAGYNHPTIVLNDDGFLPDDVDSPYEFFSGFTGLKSGPLYFNQVPKPDFWEISGNNTQAEIHNLHKKMADIYYAKPGHRRLVKEVVWYDEAGQRLFSERYNKYGKRYAQTSYDSSGQALLTSYFNAQGQEYLSEHHATGDLVLDWQGQTHVFADKTAWILYYLEVAGFELDRIFYNTLGLPFFVANRLDQPGRDVLFWNEPIGQDIPGNMKVLLAATKRSSQIMVQNQPAFEQLQRLLPEEQLDKVDFLGYHYYFQKDNQASPSIMILTNSDQIEQLQTLLASLPDWQFHVGAITEMSSRLMDLGAYPNLTLYPNISNDQVKQLYASCDVYLDINHANEILDAVRQAFDHNQVILGFGATLHQPTYVAGQHRFEQAQDLIDYLESLRQNPEAFQTAIQAQHQWAHFESPQAYQDKLD